MSNIVMHAGTAKQIDDAVTEAVLKLGTALTLIEQQAHAYEDPELYEMFRVVLYACDLLNEEVVEPLMRVHSPEEGN